MRRFQRGEIDVLVATTVIEVGVDVPNATVMVVEHAERFGLAQLHQLRGRVGRGAAKSYCILITGERISPLGEERLNAMVRTQDGFELAELDLNQRGPGEFFGTRQAGLPDFRVANLLRDRQLLELAKMEAARFANAPAASGEERSDRSRAGAVWARLKEAWQRRYGLVEAGCERRSELLRNHGWTDGYSPFEALLACAGHDGFVCEYNQPSDREAKLREAGLDDPVLLKSVKDPKAVEHYQDVVGLLINITKE
jgi:superfamily II DNA/RNA helicase